MVTKVSRDVLNLDAPGRPVTDIQIHGDNNPNNPSAAINGTPIGNNLPSTGRFSDITVNDFNNITDENGQTLGDYAIATVFNTFLSGTPQSFRELGFTTLSIWRMNEKKVPIFLMIHDNSNRIQIQDNRFQVNNSRYTVYVRTPEENRTIEYAIIFPFNTTSTYIVPAGWSWRIFEDRGGSGKAVINFDDSWIL